MTEYIEEKKLTDDGGVIKKMIKAGAEDAPIPTEGQKVKVEYEGKLEDGTVFDSGEIDIDIGTGQVIKGWDIGVMAMKLGEKAELVCQSDYAYGDSGSPPKIPGKATLIFTVTLKWMDIQMTDEELFAEATKQKTLGNDKFKAKDYKEAVDMYNEAMESLDKMKSWDDNEEMQKLRISCLQNASVCLNSIGHFGQTVDKCTKVIQIDKNAVKAFYLRSVAHTKLQNFEEALTDIKEAIKLSPSDKKFR